MLPGIRVYLGRLFHLNDRNIYPGVKKLQNRCELDVVRRIFFLLLLCILLENTSKQFCFSFHITMTAMSKFVLLFSDGNRLKAILFTPP